VVPILRIEHHKVKLGALGVWIRCLSDVRAA
jgi:hypothetical protein